MSLPEINLVVGLIVDSAKSAYHGYPCREGTLLQYRRRPIARARMGETIKIVGKLRAVPPPFIAPLTGATCVWYRTVVQTWDGFVYSPRQVVEHKMAGPVHRRRDWIGVAPHAARRGQPAGDAGAVGGRTARPVGRTERRRDGARYREIVLRDGEQVAVLGKVIHEPDPTEAAAGLRHPALRVVLGEPPDAVIVSNEDGVWW